MAASATSDFGLPRRSAYSRERAHQIRFEIDRHLLFHSNSQIETIVGVEGGLPSDGSHPPAEDICPDGFVISLVSQLDEGIHRRWRFRRDRVMLGKSRLSTDPGVVRIFADAPIIAGSEPTTGGAKAAHSSRAAAGGLCTKFVNKCGGKMRSCNCLSS